MDLAPPLASDSRDLEAALRDLPVDRIDVAQPRLFELGFAERYLERLRREAPVHHCRDGVFGSYWSITRHADISATELDTERFSSDHFNGGITIRSSAADEEFLPSFIAMDPPAHTAQRRVVAPAFAPRPVSIIADQVRAWSQEILDGLPIEDTFDWADRVSMELTARTLAWLLGYPQEQARDLIHWSNVMVSMPGAGVVATQEEKLRIMRECFGTFEAIWQRRLAEPGGDDLISMLAGGSETREMSRPLFYGNIVLLIVGGNDTTRNSLSGSVVALDRYPQEFDKLRADPSLTRNLASEIIRWQTPLAHMRRTTTCDVTVDGHMIPAGEKVVLWYLSANRDEMVFEDAERFMLDRANARRHLSFGTGIHRCIGARLAELQVEILWQEFLARFRTIELAGEPQRTFSTFVNGYTTVPVRIPADAVIR